ncbi:allantoinase [Penicillium brevicompactum]
MDEHREANAAADIICGQGGIIDCLFHVEGLPNLLPQATIASNKTGAEAMTTTLQRPN